MNYLLVVQIFVRTPLGSETGGIQQLARYHNPVYLWILIPVFLFWIMRIWLKAVRGALHDDPVVFAARDWVSQLALAIGAAALWAAG